LRADDANIDQSSLVQLFLPVAGDQQITRWRQNQPELLTSAMHSLSSLIKLVRKEPMLLRAARELRNNLLNIIPLQTTLLPEPAQLRALFPMRSWLLWLPTLPGYINHPRHIRLIAPFLANYEMVRMAQGLVLPGIRHSIGLHERAMAIQSASAQMGSGFEASGVHTNSVMHGPLSMAKAYLDSSPNDQVQTSMERMEIHAT
jgi:hypothetical protein